MTYAHVTTYRLGTSAEVEADVASAEIISDQSARTIASWWHSPSVTCRQITSLSHGLPFDTEVLRVEIDREITDDGDRAALTEWLDALESVLADGSMS